MCVQRAAQINTTPQHPAFISPDAASAQLSAHCSAIMHSPCIAPDFTTLFLLRITSTGVFNVIVVRILFWGDPVAVWVEGMFMVWSEPRRFWGAWVPYPPFEALHVQIVPKNSDKRKSSLSDSALYLWTSAGHHFWDTLYMYNYIVYF